MKETIKPPTIPEQDKSPLVLELLAFIENQGSLIQKQAEQIQQLKDEVARLKNQPPRPDIKQAAWEK
jgi:hypothetical protein